VRIVSKFKDYYDGVVGYSESPLYIRDDKLVDSKKLIEWLKKFPKPLATNYSLGYCGSIYINSVIIGFCGRLYPYYILDVIDYPLNHKKYKYPCINPSDVQRIVESEFKIKIKIQTHDYWKKYCFNDNDFQEFTKNLNANGYDYFQEFKVPIFSVTGGYNDMQVTLNPSLKDQYFQSIIDPWTAYQEIERFVGNDLVFDPLTEFKMDDKLKRDSKGFDDWSFKKRRNG